jgi:hypothetical protein
MRPDGSISIPTTSCLHCGTRLDSISDTNGVTRPQPGDPVACIRCGAVATVDDLGSLRPFTPKEARELADNADLMRQLRRLVGLIHFVTGARN